MPNHVLVKLMIEFFSHEKQTAHSYLWMANEGYMRALGKANVDQTNISRTDANCVKNIRDMLDADYRKICTLIDSLTAILHES
jgi:hypothetical protein